MGKFITFWRLLRGFELSKSHLEIKCLETNLVLKLHFFSKEEPKVAGSNTSVTIVVISSLQTTLVELSFRAALST